MLNFNKNIFGQAFIFDTVEAVWQKGKIDYNIDSTGRFYRRDACGALMKRSEYGNTDSRYGWEVDHILPKSSGGRDNLANLQPLQWENNRYKADNYPGLFCKIRA